MNNENNSAATEIVQDLHCDDERIVRVKKLEQMTSLGLYPFVEKFNKQNTAAEIILFDVGKLRENDLVQNNPNDEVSVAGRIVSIRRHGKVIFADLQDETGEIQISFLETTLGAQTYSYVQDFLDLGDFVGICGEPSLTRQKKLAIVCSSYVFLGKSLLPLPTKFYGIEDVEKKYRQRYLDIIIHRPVYDRFKKRSQLVQEFRSWLISHNFIELSTRTLQPQAGGAVAKPFVTHHNALNHDFALRISPELDLKMAIIAGFERVFEFATNFRNEGIDPSHLQEFQMLEWYCAYENFEQGLVWVEEMFKTLIPKVLGSEFFIVHDRQGNVCEINIAGNYRRITFSALLAEHDIDIFSSKEQLLEMALHAGLDKQESEKRSRANLLDDVYKKLVRPNIIQPTFITHYPSDLLPLARPNTQDPRFADSYQLVIASWEVVKGYSELVDPILQRKALEAQSLAKQAGDDEAMVINEEYLAAMEHGMPPITGCGIGIDRLITLITGQKNLRDCVLFPLVKPDDGYEYF